MSTNNTNTNGQNTNTNGQGGTNMNNNFQVPQGVDPTMFFMMQMQQQSQENMLLMIQQMNQNNPNSALLQMVLNNQNNQNNQPLSPLGQRLNDVTTFANMITPTTDELTTAGDRAVAKAESEYNTAFAAVQALSPQATDAQIENVLKTFGKVPLTQEQQDSIRAKAEEEVINRKTEAFNKAVTGLSAFEATYTAPTAPVAAPVAPIPAPPSQQRRTLPETISDTLRANAEAKIAWCKTAYNIK